ncbi:MAG: phosphohistidine phosphatase SixA [Polyangiaceae bacterium]|nr:phosphohistidine phosphatase SixA [Polyangiaceae bacterium]
MEILIIRHGQATDDAGGLGDAGRWLTGKGRKVTRRVARWLARSDDRRPATIWTSPLVRAVQTAEIIAEAAELTDEVSVLEELTPVHAPADLVRLLPRHRGAGPIALVGHEPLLSLLASSLLGPGPSGASPEIKLRKSGVIALAWDGKGRAKLRFLLDPREMIASTELPPEGEPREASADAATDRRRD